MSFAYSRYALALLRVVSGFMFTLHGAQKLFGVVGGHRMPMFSLLWVAGILETFGGAMITVGLFTRYVAFILCGEMVVAYFRAHAGRGLLPINNGGELAVLYCFIFLYVFAEGPGAFSLDRGKGRSFRRR